MPLLRLCEGRSPSIDELFPPHGAITDEDHGAYVVIASWIMMCFFTSSVSIRILTRFIPIRIYGVDDVMIGLSMATGIAQTVAIHISASNGLGRHIQSLSSNSYQVLAKTYYTADLLYLMTIYLAKMSLVLFIMRLTPSHKTLSYCYGLMLAMTLWMLATMGLLAFRCQLPRRWDSLSSESARCAIDMEGLYYSIGAVDILTDVAIIATPAVIVWGVRISRRQRFTVIGVFSSRVAVIICSAQLLASIPGFIRSSDRTWEAVSPQAWRQIVQSLSIITACIPCLRPFLASLESGLMDSSMGTVVGTTYRASSGGKRDRNPEASLALTSLATVGRDAIIIPRHLDRNRDARNTKLEQIRHRAQSLESQTQFPSITPNVSEQENSRRPDGAETVYAGPQNYSCTHLPSSKTPAGSVRDMFRHDADLPGRGGPSTESINMLASHRSGEAQKSMHAENVIAGCIKETREIVISIENKHRV